MHIPPLCPKEEHATLPKVKKNMLHPPTLFWTPPPTPSNYQTVPNDYVLTFGGTVVSFKMYIFCTVKHEQCL